MELEGLGELRDELLATLSGSVVEVGCGNGLNFAHYPRTTAHVQAVEPEPHLRRLAEEAAQRSSVSVSVSDGTAGSLPLPDASMDAGVLCLVLCSITDRAGAVAELARVIRPGGSLAFLEHCTAETPVLRTVQRIADATLWPVLTGGCHTTTDPIGLISEGGFRVEQARRLRFPAERPTVPASPHVLGRASRPCEGADGSRGQPALTSRVDTP
jgi:ubiquinone/menaquinone biosynthesis C-methylase UbiE